MKTLSPKQQQIYDYIVSFSGLHGYPPSVREIGEYVGLKSPSTVHFHLKGLEAAGLITKAEERPVPLPSAAHTRARRSRRERARPGACGGRCGRRSPHSGPGVH
ncbi:MAG: LexA family protein [Flavonifractor plautii]